MGISTSGVGHVPGYHGWYVTRRIGWRSRLVEGGMATAGELLTLSFAVPSETRGLRVFRGG